MLCQHFAQIHFSEQSFDQMCIYIYSFYVSSNPFVQFECQNYWNIPKPLLSVNISHWTSLGVHVFLTECVTLSQCVSLSLYASQSLYIWVSLLFSLFLSISFSECVILSVSVHVCVGVCLSESPSLMVRLGTSPMESLSVSLLWVSHSYAPSFTSSPISSVKSNTHHSLGDAESTWPNQEPTFGTEHCSTLINIICWRSNLEYGPGPSSLRQVRYLRSHGYTKQLY